MKKNILYFFLVYTISYFIFDKDKIYLNIVEKEKTNQKSDSINIILFSSNFTADEKNKREIEKHFIKKGHKVVTITQLENIDHFHKHLKSLNYSLTLNDFPFCAFVSESIYAKPYARTWESVYIWCFFKWIRVYHKDAFIS